MVARFGAYGVLVASLLAFAAAAPAQMIVGLIAGNIMELERHEHECMMGQTMSLHEIDETRATAYNSMSVYWSLVSGSHGQPVDIRPAYSSDTRSKWSVDGRTIAGDQLASVGDPFAAVASGGTATLLDGHYVRAGDGAMVQGIWQVTASDGRPVGAYDARFVRTAGNWHLRSLSLLQLGALTTALPQFCHKPGDVEPYRVAFAAKEAKRAAKRAAREADEARRAATGG